MFVGYLWHVSTLHEALFLTETYREAYTVCFHLHCSEQPQPGKLVFVPVPCGGFTGARRKRKPMIKSTALMRPMKTWSVLEGKKPGIGLNTIDLSIKP